MLRKTVLQNSSALLCHKNEKEFGLIICCLKFYSVYNCTAQFYMLTLITLAVVPKCIHFFESYFEIIVLG